MSLSPHSCLATPEYFSPRESQRRLVYKHPRTAGKTHTTPRLEQWSLYYSQEPIKGAATATAPAPSIKDGSMAMGDNGVKVTYIETQFVTSDAAGFKSLVQRLTGKPSRAGAAAEPARQLHRPRPRRAGAAADGRRSAGFTATGSSSYCMPTAAGSASAAANDARTANAGTAQPGLDELHELCDYSELFSVVGTGERHRGGSDTGFLY